MQASLVLGSWRDQAVLGKLGSFPMAMSAWWSSWTNLLLHGNWDRGSSAVRGWSPCYFG